MAMAGSMVLERKKVQHPEEALPEGPRLVEEAVSPEGARRSVPLPEPVPLEGEEATLLEAVPSPLEEAPGSTELEEVLPRPAADGRRGGPGTNRSFMVCCIAAEIGGKTVEGLMSGGGSKFDDASAPGGTPGPMSRRKMHLGKTT